jgi:hypothetical protein
VARKLNESDKRALKIGAACVLGILVFVFASDWLGHWWDLRSEVAEKRNNVDSVSLSEAKWAELRKKVPVFEMPEKYEVQKYPFRDKLDEQLKKRGIKKGTLQFLPLGRSEYADKYRLLSLQCRRAKCNFGQVLDLLAVLPENPYMAGIEELKIKCDPKKRKEFELDLTVSTFVK